jgi:hypothetical protein
MSIRILILNLFWMSGSFLYRYAPVFYKLQTGTVTYLQQVVLDKTEGSAGRDVVCVNYLPSPKRTKEGGVPA